MNICISKPKKGGDKNKVYKHYQAVKSMKLSKRRDERFVIIDIQTNKIVDDAQGYGYKSPKRAYACFGYKQTRKK